MVVWNIPDDRVEEIGMCIGKYSSITLSYRRPRRLPEWPYNLFTMIHGCNREEVSKSVAEIANSCGLQNIEYDILFSTQRFKQRGASYVPAQNQSKKMASLHLIKNTGKHKRPAN